MNEKIAYARSGGYRYPSRALAYEGGPPRLAMPSDKYQDVMRYEIYDTLRFVRGFPVKAAALQLFAIQLGQQTQAANAPHLSYSKLECDTNLKNPRQLPKGKTFLLDSIQVDILNVAGHAYNQTGEGVSYDTDHTRPVTEIGSATQLVKHLMDTVILRTTFGSDKDYETGLLKFFPSAYGMSGFAGGVTGSGQNLPHHFESAVQNGFGRARQLLTPRRIEGQENFEAVIEPNIPFVPDQDFQIRVILSGVQSRQVQ